MLLVRVFKIGVPPTRVIIPGSVNCVYRGKTGFSRNLLALFRVTKGAGQECDT